ncbi:hypothetical protein H0H92_002007 [Tricholoma furcatifolium]|nr:hypothetical protein H0H92_002007 [Tricholoma furcatifolium]
MLSPAVLHILWVLSDHLNGVADLDWLQASLSEKYSLAASPAQWGVPLNVPEDDDALHNPTSGRDRKNDGGSDIFTVRGLVNLGCKQTTQGGFNLGGVNATGQVPSMPGNWGLIDLDTPQEAYKKQDYMNGDDWVLVFSDEFNQDGRTFYPGDDPYWEAVDLHYWGTDDLEWYDPIGATTQDGYLTLTLDYISNPADNHNLSYRSSMIQSWNKFCFTGGMIEVNVSLPGSATVPGLWPAVWTMGNLGRAGYGASLDGLWPFSYDSCDVGTLPNQTYPGTQTPLAAVTNGDPTNNNELSFLPGQRLSACTCTGESHPGPATTDGSYVGRAAPEIDVFEAIVTDEIGYVSMSAQWAPFNAAYDWLNTSANLIIPDPNITVLNPYKGGVFQQSTSGLSLTNQLCYEGDSGCFSTYGFQYQPGFDSAYITWINNGNIAWTIMQGGLAADSATEIGPRSISQEPMYIIANLGLSYGFGNIDFTDMQFPSTLRIDYIRVYQPASSQNIGCDPADFPTAAYINTYMEAYTNPNLTTWVNDFGQPWPKNKLMPAGCSRAETIAVLSIGHLKTAEQRLKGDASRLLSNGDASRLLSNGDASRLLSHAPSLRSMIIAHITTTPTFSNGRSIWSIVWSCLTTIFACTWIAIHPNVPVLGEKLVARRLKIFAMALLAPELIVLWAFRQWWSSRKLARKYNQFGWTRTHAFFAIMGGFKVCANQEDGSRVTLNPDDVEPYLINKDIDISEQEILDKSKGDVISKSLVVLQVTWFMLQVLARAIQGLAITELEVVTLAFALLNIMTYFCWWSKPLDVNLPVVISAYYQPPNSIPIPHPSAMSPIFFADRDLIASNPSLHLPHPLEHLTDDSEVDEKVEATSSPVLSSVPFPHESKPS